MAKPLPPWSVVVLAALTTQVFKFVLYWVANRRLTLRPLVTTNGFPSLYAVSFGCLCTLVLLAEGYDSPLFVATFVFSGIVLHDAVRLQGSVDRGGRAALLVAQSIRDDDHDHPWLAQLRPWLRDRRHRPLHIAAGLALGVIAGILGRASV